MTLAASFGPFGGRAWLDTAHQGPLPRAGAAAAAEAVEDKVAPARIEDASFHALPGELKRRLGRVIGAPPEDVVLGNSTTYGLHLLARGLPLRAGDEVLFVAGEFPATVVPWLPLRDHGVRIRFVEPSTRPLAPDELAAALTPRTRVFCCSWVFSFSGEAVDLDAWAACAVNGGSRSSSTAPRGSARSPSTSAGCRSTRS